MTRTRSGARTSSTCMARLAGAVYLAREIALDRLVAIKVLPPDAADNTDRRARFRREAQLAAKLSHPNIVPLHSFGEKDGVSYYLMGYVRGESLADRIRREGRIPHGETRLMLAQLADALEYAHAKGVIHRDIKPDNILLVCAGGRRLWSPGWPGRPGHDQSDLR
jgi:serine/threonine-protein kinase